MMPDFLFDAEDVLVLPYASEDDDFDEDFDDDDFDEDFDDDDFDEDFDEDF